MSGLPAEPHLGTLQRLLFAFVKHGFVICLSRAEQVVDDSSELAADPAEELLPYSPWRGATTVPPDEVQWQPGFGLACSW